jgi:2-oxoglutarate dehydrogenase E2 component (dihydrolipoamide succinyltransferase)
MTDIVVPTLGESVSEATVAKWMKKAGDSVRKDETLVELETDKVSVEVSAPEAGVLSEIVAAEGATVGIGALLGRLGGAGMQPAAAPKAEAPKPPAPQPAPSNGAAKQAPPSVQRIAAENNVDLSGVTGSGRDGRVTKADALAIIENRGAPQQPAPPRTRRSPPASSATAKSACR